jgi:hypothetical protein
MRRFRQTLSQRGKPLLHFSKVDYRAYGVYRFLMLTPGLRHHLIKANFNATKLAFNAIKAALHRGHLRTYCLQVRCDEILNNISHFFDCSHTPSHHATLC